MNSPLLKRLMPWLQWWPQVNRSTLRADLIAGLVSAIVVVPQGVAFATLAGLPPQYGLYLAMIPAVVAALWGSSWHAVSGPTTAVSLFVFATLAPLATPGSAQYVQLALTLSFMSGAIMLVLGLARLGTVVNFISHTVVVGFTAGAGFLIAASQLRNFFGLEIARGQSFFATVWAFVTQVAEVRPFVVLVAGITLAAGLLARRLWTRVPYMIVALVVGTLAGVALNALLGAERTGISMVGALPSPIPPLSLPDLSLGTLSQLAGIAIAVTILSLTEAISIARAIALRSGQRIDGNQEFIGQGLANIAASFFSGYPSSASFNRSGLNYEAGARTPLAAIFSAPLLVLLLIAIAPLVAYIPLAVMAAILFLVAWGLIDRHAIEAIRRSSAAESWVLAITFIATLTLNLEIAILTGVLASLIVYLNRTARPIMRSLVPDPRHRERRMAELEPGLSECPQLKILRIEGSIYFGAVNHIATHFDTLRGVSPTQKHLLVMAKSINFVDVAGADLLAHEARQRAALGGRLYFYSLRQPVRDMLERAGHLRAIGTDNVFASKDQAIAGVFAQLDHGICANCPTRIFRECASVPARGVPPPSQ